MKVRQFILGLAFCLTCADAQANYLVTVGSILLPTGSNGYVPVYISSDSGDSLASTNFEFRITTAGATRLEFGGSPNPTGDPTFSNSAYVFFGNSADYINSFPLGVASQSIVPADTFVGGDGTNDFSNVTVPGSNVLLAELQVTAATALPPGVGDTFTINLMPSTDSGLNGLNGNTGFADNNGTFYSFGSMSGNVTIVPEPTSWVLGLIGLSAILLCRLWRLRNEPGCDKYVTGEPF
jgi:hypothetical protein